MQTFGNASLVSFNWVVLFPVQQKFHTFSHFKNEFLHFSNGDFVVLLFFVSFKRLAIDWEIRTHLAFYWNRVLFLVFFSSSFVFFFQKLITACLASYGTETVMQLCHGRRRCTISADRANFGNPCRPESRVYLKVVYTCSEYSCFLFLKNLKEFTTKRKEKPKIKTSSQMIHDNFDSINFLWVKLFQFREKY